MALTLSQIIKVEKSFKGKSIATIVYKRLTMIAPMSKWYNCDHYLVITVVEIPRGQLWSPKNLYFLHNLWLKFCWPQVYVPIHHTSRGICHTYSSFSTFSIELIRKEWWWFGRNDDDSEGMMMICLPSHQVWITCQSTHRPLLVLKPSNVSSRLLSLTAN